MKGKCFCPLAEAEERVQESHEEQEEGPPEHDDWDAAASHQDGDQRDPPVLPPRPEELLPQPVERAPPEEVVEGPPPEEVEEGPPPEEVVEGPPPVEVVERPPPVEVVVRAAQRPAQVSQRGEPDTASPQAGVTVPDRPARVRRKISNFS